jgi:predicted RNA methylase
MKLKQLESLLSEVQVFEDPKSNYLLYIFHSHSQFRFHSVELEQVPTSAHIASRMIYTAANQYDDIENCMVGDFGCGTGMLSIGCNALGSQCVVGFDIDESALETAWINCKAMEITDIDFVHMNIQSLSLATSKEKEFVDKFFLSFPLLYFPQVSILL